MAHKQIFVNVPIKDMARSLAFFKALGYNFNPDFSNEQGACMLLGDKLYAMLLVEDFFKTFTPKTIIDAHQGVEVLIALDCENREEVDAIIAKAVAAGGSEARPVQDLGFMYSRAFNDLDGHTWEFFHMVDASQAQG